MTGTLFMFSGCRYWPSLLLLAAILVQPGWQAPALAIVECSRPEDCLGTDGPCGSRACVNNLCGFSFEPEGTPCGAPVGECGIRATCSGESSTCDLPAPSVKPASTPCGPEPMGECGIRGSCTGSSDVCS